MNATSSAGVSFWESCRRAVRCGSGIRMNCFYYESFFQHEYWVALKPRAPQRVMLELKTRNTGTENLERGDRKHGM